jgi:hypothetical protein
MRDIRLSGSEGGGTEPNWFSLWLFLIENKQKQILRDAQDDIGGGVFISLLDRTRLSWIPADADIGS